MPANQIQFTGINRRITDYAQTGACEELINLRPTEAGLIPTRPHKILFEGTDYLNAWTHEVGAESLLIISRRDGDDLIFCRLMDDGSLVEICRFGAYDDVAVATLANMLVFSDKTTKENRTFRWNGQTYTEQNYNVTMPDAEFTFGELEVFYSKMPRWEDDVEFADVVQPGFDAVQNQHKHHCFGNTLVALNFRCKDGSEFWTARWLLPDLIPSIKTEGPDLDCPWIGSSTIGKYITTVDNEPYALCYVRASGSENAYIYLAGAPLTVTLKQINEYDRETSMVEAVNIYASKPKVCINTTVVDSSSGTNTYQHRCPLKQPDDMQKELLYFQKTVYMTDLLKGDVETELEFGGDIQTTSKTLDVDAGPLMRYGDMLSYNSRIHFYNATARVYATTPGISGGTSLTNSTIYGVFTLSTGQERVMKLGEMPVSPTSRIICPDSRVTRLLIVNPLGIAEVPMQASPRYNYSYNFDGEFTFGSNPDLYALVDTATEDNFTYDEPQDMNVSEQMNPFVFDVSHSYRFPGRILDVQVQLAEASDVAFGTHPLNVMTTDGVYTLAQGSGNVLYGNITKVNDLVATGKSASTKQGVFVLAAGGLWLVAGRFTTLVSEALNGGPHKYLRSNSDYQALCGTASPLYNISPYVSNPEFRDYVIGASLSFDQWEDDLIVSNRNYAYSYVLSLKHRQWFKISERMSQSNVGDKLALRETSSSGGTAATETFGLYHLFDANTTNVKHYAKLNYFEDFDHGFDYKIEIITDQESWQGQATFYNDLYDKRTFIAELLNQAGLSSATYLTYQDDYVYALNDSLADATITITKVGAGNTVANGAFSPITNSAAPGIVFGEGTYYLNCGTAAAVMTLGSSTTRRQNMTTLVTLINSSSFPVTATFNQSAGLEQYDTLTLTAKDIGAAGNNLNLYLSKQGAGAVNFGPLDGGTEPYVISDIIDISDIQLEYEIIEGQTVPTGRTAPVTVHLESRPMAPGQYMYTHVYRVVQLVRAKLENDDNLTVALYGSEDLQNWVLLTNAQRKEVILSQIRTGMAPKSWRYFKYTVGGTVIPETDFGPVLMDFHTGRRRIG